MANITEFVARQYTEYCYPEPVSDLEDFIAKGNYLLGDPSLFSVQLWPEGLPSHELNILVAGCGTNQAAWTAFLNPSSSVLGVDLSRSSLEHEQFLKEKYNLINLELMQADIVGLEAIGRNFDLILCTGVLHHLENPQAGMTSLSRLLTPDGVVFAMLYSLTARSGIYILQDLFRKLQLKQDKNSIIAVREVVNRIGPNHPAAAFLKGIRDKNTDAELVDLFLNANDIPFDVEQILSVLKASGMEFQCWDENSEYYPEATFPSGSSTRTLLEPLSLQDLWSAVDRVRAGRSMHGFMACLPDRLPRATISKNRHEWRDFYPCCHPHLVFTHVDGSKPGWFAQRPGLSMSCDERSVRLMRAADGSETIAEIAKRISEHETVSDRDMASYIGFFNVLYERGHIFISKVKIINASNAIYNHEQSAAV